MNTDVVVQEAPAKKHSFKKWFLMSCAVITTIFCTMFSASAATPNLVMPLQVSEGDLSNLGVVFTQIASWVSTIVSTITASPILLIGLGIFVVGAIIGLAYRLIRG